MADKKRIRTSRAQAFFEIARADADADDGPSSSSRSVRGAPVDSTRAPQPTTDSERPEGDRPPLESPPTSNPATETLSVTSNNDPQATEIADRTAGYTEAELDVIERRRSNRSRSTLKPPGSITASLTTEKLSHASETPKPSKQRSNQTNRPPAAEDDTLSATLSQPTSPDGETTVRALDAPGLESKRHPTRRKRIERLRRRVERQPGEAKAIIELAVCLLEDGERTEAIALFERALRLEPENAFVLRRLDELGRPRRSAEASADSRARTKSPFELARAIVPAAALAAAGGALEPIEPTAALVAFAAAALWVIAAQGAAVQRRALGRAPFLRSLRYGLGAVFACFLLPALLAALTWFAWPRPYDSARLESETNVREVVARYAELLAKREHLDPATARARAIATLDLSSVKQQTPVEIPLQVWIVAALTGLTTLYGLFYYPLALNSALTQDSARAALDHLENWQSIRARFVAYRRALFSASSLLAAGVLVCLLGTSLPERLPGPLPVRLALSAALTAAGAGALFTAAAGAVGRLAVATESAGEANA